MVKPRASISTSLPNKGARLPVAAYQVSGEYSMIRAAAASGWMKEKEALLESLTCIKRGGPISSLRILQQVRCGGGCSDCKRRPVPAGIKPDAGRRDKRSVLSNPSVLHGAGRDPAVYGGREEYLDCCLGYGRSFSATPNGIGQRCEQLEKGGCTGRRPRRAGTRPAHQGDHPGMDMVRFVSTVPRQRWLQSGLPGIYREKRYHKDRRGVPRRHDAVL
jgi:hypothetical protein